MATINFTVGYGTTLEEARSDTPSTVIYAEDLNLCQRCIDIVGNCFPCLITDQQVFSDSGMTTIVPDGYYCYPYNELVTNCTWHIVGGYPQSAGFFG